MCYVQEKNCEPIFLSQQLLGCVLGYYSTVRVPVREIWPQNLVAAGQCSSSCVNEYHEFPTRIIQWAFDFYQFVASPQPDLYPLDFFLWGYLKNRVYMTAPWYLEELKGNIARETENIDQRTLKHVFLNLMKCCRIYIYCKIYVFIHFWNPFVQLCIYPLAGNILWYTQADWIVSLDHRSIGCYFPKYETSISQHETTQVCSKWKLKVLCTTLILTCFMFLLWSTLLLVFLAYPTIFPLLCESLVQVCTLYYFSCAANVHSYFSFLKLYTSTRSEAGHETCSSSWSCGRN